MGRNLSAALEYVCRIRPVFPCHEVGPEGHCSCRKGPLCEHPGKHPRWEGGTLDHGHKDATRDEGRIRHWWDKWPHANVAALVQPGEMILDVDPRNGGFESLRTLEAEYGPIPKSVVARTGGGGLHYYLKLPPDAEVKNDNTGNKLGPGLDVKVNGYVLVPPSRTNKGDYSWLSGGFACVAGAREDAERAARLWGAAQALHETKDIPRDIDFLTEADSRTSTVRSGMGEEAWEEAWRKGRTMILDEAISYALEEEEAGA